MNKTAGRNTVDELGGNLVNDRPSLLLFDFDSPDNPAVSKMGSNQPVELEYTTAGGDSGGGLSDRKIMLGNLSESSIVPAATWKISAKMAIIDRSQSGQG